MFFLKEIKLYSCNINFVCKYMIFEKIIDTKFFEKYKNEIF